MRTSITVALLVLIAFPATAQIVSPAGTMDIFMSVQHTHIDAHTDGSGTIAHNIDLRAISASIAVEYSLTDRFALGMSVPYINSRYRGPAPHPGAIVDDGSRHGALQDLQIEARYALTRGEFVVTPFAGFRYPTREYATMGHASPGRGLKELDLGVSAGHQLAAFPNLLIGANVSHSVPEAVEGMRVNRTKADVQLGYAVAPRLFVRLVGAWQYSHGGIDLPVPPTSEHFHHHDQISRTNHTRAGAGAIVSLTDDVHLHASYSTVVRSVNAHIGRSVGVGISWTLDRRAWLQKRIASK